MMEKIQRFGGAMMTPVLLFAFSGLMLALTIVLNNPMLVGAIANEGTLWNSIWSIIEGGAWAVFNQIEILFVIGLPIGLAKLEKGRASMTALIIYLTFNYFIGGILEHFGMQLGIDYFGEIGAGTGLTSIAGIRTLDTNIIGAIGISAIAIWIHNRYFNKKLPEFLGIFQGSTFVFIIGFFTMIPVAILTALIWPRIQMGINSMQGLMATSGIFGVWTYTFLERILIPTGLHHFIWTPFILGLAVIEGGIQTNWLENMSYFAQSSKPLVELFPAGQFSLHGMSKVFGSPGIAAAIYATAKPENRRRVLAILLPVTLTAVLTGITEPLEFTFLFVAPILFVVHALLAATMSATMYIFGVVGSMGGGLIDFIALNWLPLFANHWPTYLTQVVIGLIFTGIYFLIFRFLILKFDFATPGREATSEEEIKLYKKQDFKEKQEDERKAEMLIALLGGAENIVDVNNCITRLRLTLKDETLMVDDVEFKKAGAHGTVRKGKAVQVIIGPSVIRLRNKFDQLLEKK